MGGHVVTRLRQWFCGLIMHRWTCAAEQGIKPTKAQLDGGITGFFDYARMYCKRCGYVYKPERTPR